MKLKNLFLTALCALTLTVGFTSCNDSDTHSWRDGSKVDLPDYRGFILSEGTMNKNNSHLFFVNPATGETYAEDIFEAQNGIKLGDTANDIITYNGDLYIIVNVSKMLWKLSGAGVMQASYSFNDELGEPRNIVAYNGKLYVTCYGGYVVRFDANTLAIEAKVKTDANPEQLVVYNGKIYCVNSGYGSGHTMSVIDINDFTTATSIECPANPFGLQAGFGKLYILSYRPDYTTMVSVFDLQTNTFKEIGNGSRMWAEGNTLYVGSTVNKGDWSNPDYETTFYIYNAATDSRETWNLSGIPEALSKSTVYMIERNPYDGSFYIATADYYSNSPVYHFSSTGSYLGSFSAGGINANNMVFLQ